MGDGSVVNTLIIALLGMGGATFVWTVVKSVIAWRDRAEGREDKAVGRLERFEQQCRDDLAWEREIGNYWYRVVGILQHELAQNGITMPELPPAPQRSLRGK